MPKIEPQVAQLPSFGGAGGGFKEKIKANFDKIQQ